jgi:hypothetical protein
MRKIQTGSRGDDNCIQNIIRKTEREKTAWESEPYNVKYISRMQGMRLWN